jgi:uncharacterized membrane protein
MFCQKCGAELEEGAKFCNNCGAPVDAAGTPAAAPAPAPAPAPKAPEEWETYSAAEDGASYTEKQLKVITMVLAIGSYAFLPIAIIVAIFFKDKNFLKHHANNAIVLAIFCCAAGIIGVIPILGWIVAPVVSVFCIVMMVFCIIAAVKGKCYKMPVIGGIKILK